METPNFNYLAMLDAFLSFSFNSLCVHACLRPCFSSLCTRGYYKSMIMYQFNFLLASILTILGVLEYTVTDVGTSVGAVVQSTLESTVTKVGTSVGTVVQGTIEHIVTEVGTSVGAVTHVGVSLVCWIR